MRFTVSFPKKCRPSSSSAPRQRNAGASSIETHGQSPPLSFSCASVFSA